MCKTCRRIESEGVAPKDMLERDVRLVSVDKHGEPVFTSATGEQWSLERHAIHEDVWFVPVTPE